MVLPEALIHAWSTTLSPKSSAGISTRIWRRLCKLWTTSLACSALAMAKVMLRLFEQRRLAERYSG